MKTTQEAGLARIWELDLLRALAVLGMLCFHWFYLLDYWEIQEVALFEGAWDIFGDVIRNTFFVVVGASMLLSYQRNQAKQKSFFHFGLKTMKRGFILLFIGGLITGLSYIFSPDLPIRFGVLSFIGAALVILWPLMLRWYLLFGFMVLIWLIDHLATWQQDSILAYVLGFYPYYWPSLDYFPLVPWLASVSAGALAASMIFKTGERRYPFFKAPKVLQPVLWVGQKALIIYLLHIPVFVVVLQTLAVLGFH